MPEDQWNLYGKNYKYYRSGTKRNKFSDHDYEKHQYFKRKKRKRYGHKIIDNSKRPQLNKFPIILKLNEISNCFWSEQKDGSLHVRFTKHGQIIAHYYPDRKLLYSFNYCESYSDKELADVLEIIRKW